MFVEEINWLGSLLLNLKGVANLFGCHVAPFGTFNTSTASKSLFEMISRTTPTAIAWSATLRLAERFSLTMYNAAYLELSQRRSLATLDRALRVAAPAVNVALLGMAP